MQPLILTLLLNEEAETFFNILRQQHFPPERNYLKAHLTLFHHLPQEPKIHDDIKTICANQKPIVLQVVDVMPIGRGVAYKLESEMLQQVHKRLQQQWQSWLIPQDRQKLWPHITVQNKVAPQTARALLLQLQASFTPFEVHGLGFRLWTYLGGPWEMVDTFLFSNDNLETPSRT
jgi:hypothetical protein